MGSATNVPGGTGKNWRTRSAGREDAEWRVGVGEDLVEDRPDQHHQEADHDHAGEREILQLEYRRREEREQRLPLLAGVAQGLFDPADPAFVPRAFSITHINLTHRTATSPASCPRDGRPRFGPAGPGIQNS